MSRGIYRLQRRFKQLPKQHSLLPLESLNMADYRDIYKTPLLSAKTLGKKVIKAKIASVYPETTTDSQKNSKNVLIVELDDDATRIALNKGNATQLAHAFGRDYNDWLGKPVVVSVKKTTYMGKPCDGLDVSAAKGK